MRPSVRRPIASLAFVVPMLVALLVAPIPVAQAQASWLDAPTPTSWNSVGMAVPDAPAPDPERVVDPRCGLDERPPETAEDAAIVAKGWRLFREYRAGWATTVVMGLSDYDGMCRPVGYQVFVFHEGRFAGTLAPEAMLSRADGSLFEYQFLSPVPGENTIGATFNRYADTDPLCCPSRQAAVTYRLDRDAAGPVLVPVRIDTGPSVP